MTSFKTVDRLYLAFSLLVALAVFVAVGPGCVPLGWTDDRIVDPQGNVIYPGAGTDPRTKVIPSTGNATRDGIIYAFAAAAYGALGYYTRKVKLNGRTEAAALQTRISDLEKKAAHPSSPGPWPMTTDQIAHFREQILEDPPGPRPPQ